MRGERRSSRAESGDTAWAGVTKETNKNAIREESRECGGDE